MVGENQMVHPGAMTVLGTPIDLSRITTDTYVAAGLTDHITPWQTCYRTTQLVSGHSEFVLCSSGHIQTVVADPKHRGLGYFVNPATPPRPRTGCRPRNGTKDPGGSTGWAGWPSVPVGTVRHPQALGQHQLPAQEPAPGTYILL